MPIGDMDGLALREVNIDLYRNIVSLRSDQDLYDDLSKDPEDWAAAQQVELAYKPSAYRSHQPIIDRPFEDAELIAAIEFPFKHFSASRFSRGHFGVWYGSEELNTTVYETVYHWRNGFLVDAGFDAIEGVAIERRVHLVHCRGGLLNLLPKRNDWPELRADDYNQCQKFGERIYREGHPGLWTPSTRCEGTNAAVFNRNILSDPRNCCYLTYKIEGGRVKVWRNLDSILFLI
jgi:hypothetical protein